jgi:hypothetical protein
LVKQSPSGFSGGAFFVLKNPKLFITNLFRGMAFDKTDILFYFVIPNKNKLP